MSKRRVLLVFAIASFVAVACGSSKQTFRWKLDFSPEAGARIEVGSVSDVTGRDFGFDIEKMLENALVEELDDEHILWRGTAAGDRLILASQIVDYERGNAFKRWLLPGWGTTILSVHSELEQASDGTVVALVDTRRTVSIGGGYSIGAWRTIFASVAEDIAEEIAEQLEDH